MSQQKIVIQKFIYLISLCIFLNFGILITSESLSNLLHNEDFILNGGFLYASIYIYAVYLIVKKILTKWEVNFLHLVYVRIGLALLIYLIVFKFNVTPFWNFHKYNYTLIDDKEYQEDPNADDDPIYGRDGSGYVSTFKYFLPINADLEGLVLPIGKIEKDSGSQYYLVDKYENEFPINVTFSIFWQSAYSDGYKPVQKNNFQIGGFLKRIYQLGPYFLFELVLSNLGLTLLFTSIIILISVFSSSFIINYIDYNKLGIALYDQKDYHGAISIFDKAIKSDSKIATYYYNRGLAKLCIKRNKDASEDFNKAIELYPNEKDYYYNRGLSRHNLKDYRGAIEDFNQAIFLDSKNATYYYYRGVSKYSSDDYYGSVSDQNKAIEFNPEYTFAYWNRGNSKDCLKDYQGALDDFNKVIELDPQYGIVYYNRGRAKYLLKDYYGSIKDLDCAIKINPEENRYFSWRGLSKYQLKDYYASIEDFNKAIELKPDDHTSICNRALSKYYLKDFKGSIDDYNYAIKIDPSIKIPHYLEPYKDA